MRIVAPRLLLTSFHYERGLVHFLTQKSFEMNPIKSSEERFAIIEGMLIAGKEVLTLNEVSLYTGLSKSYLHKLTASKQIPHFKPFGKIVFFNRDEIIDWLQQRRVETSKELDQRAADYLNLKKRGGRP